MKKLCIVSLFCLFTLNICHGQSFEKIYATPNDEAPTCSLEDSNAFYFAGNLQVTFGNNVFTGIIYKLDKSGNLEKSITLPDCILRFIKFNSGHYYIGGNKLDSNNLQSNYIAEIDTGLNLIWEKYYYIGQSSILTDLIFLDNELYCSGYTINTEQEYIYKFDLSGDSLNNIILPLTSFAGLACSLSAAVNNKLVLTSNYGNSLGTHLCFVVLDTALNIIDSTYNDYMFFLYTIKCKANDYYVSGMAFDSSMYNPPYQGYNTSIGARLCKFDSNFQLTNYKDFNSLSYLEYSAIAGFDFSSNGDIYFIYSTNCDSNNFFFSSGFSQFGLVCLDSNFNIKYQKFFGVKYNFAMSVQATHDGGCLITGTRYDNSNPYGYQRDIYIVKTDSTGLTGIGSDGNIQLYDFLLYPNPVSERSFWIQSGRNVDITSVEATDMLGRKTDLNFSREDNRIKVSNALLPGVYNITVIARDDKFESHKLLIQ